MSLDRRGFLGSSAAIAIAGVLLPELLRADMPLGAGTPVRPEGLPLRPREADSWPLEAGVETQEASGITVETIARAEELIGIDLTPEQRELMLEDLRERLDDLRALRQVPLPNATIPALRFDPMIFASATSPAVGRPAGARAADVAGPDTAWLPEAAALPEATRPTGDEDLAFASVAELASLVRAREVSSVELTELYLDRLQRYDPALEAVVTLTPERALESARRADSELDAGRRRGPLHGVPWGAKDLLAVRGYPTTWGAAPYRDQVIDADAAVVERLDRAGAVLVAKLTLGALAWGDVWFGGQTNNPWNLEQGSSGSSAGPGAAVAAGLVGFAIGSETLGSIVSPSTRNGVTGHRPTFGRVSRHGAMTLSWSMDKLGPMCRSAEDCALVFAAIQGRDGRDPTTVDVAFRWDPRSDVRGLRVGYVQEAFAEPDGEEDEYENREADLATLDVLRELGLELVPVSLPDDPPSDPLLLILNAEAAAAFEELSRTGGTDAMVRQERRAWPNVFRHARFIPAVDYVNANRARTKLMAAMADALEGFDAFVSPSFRGGTLRITNLTGHPSVTVPNAFHRVEDAPPSSPRRSPGSITFVGNLYRDDAALQLAHAYQRATDFHRRRPAIA